MNELQTAHAPSSRVVIPHFVAGGIAFLLTAILLGVSVPDLLTTYYNHKLIAITHIALLGWASMIVFGALYQLIPVVYETSLFSEKLAQLTFWCFAGSTVFLSYSLWIGSYTQLLVYASVFLFLSLLLFILNLHFTYRKSKKPNIQSKFINTAICWLAATELLGTLIALNFRFHFLNETHLHYLKIHAHLGLAGWFLLLIIGAASILIPMFLIAHNLNTKKLKYSYYLINIGLVAMAIDWLFVHSSFGIYIVWILISCGIFCFGSFVYEAFKKRIRRKLDISLQYTGLSISLIALPMLLALYLLVTKTPTAVTLRLSTFYGFSIIFGVISMLIFGQTYKILPFIVWLERYQKYVGRYKTPLPRKLYSEKTAYFQFYIYLFSVSLITVGLLIKQESILQTGTIALVLTGILNLFNILRIVLHKANNNTLEKI